MCHPHMEGATPQPLSDGRASRLHRIETSMEAPKLKNTVTCSSVTEPRAVLVPQEYTVMKSSTGSVTAERCETSVSEHLDDV
jgi:hypothetical protein